MEGKQDTRHTEKIRSAGSRSISQPGTTPAINPPAQRKADVITPGGHFAGRQATSKR